MRRLCSLFSISFYITGKIYVLYGDSSYSEEVFSYLFGYSWWMFLKSLSRSKQACNINFNVIHPKLCLNNFNMDPFNVYLSSKFWYKLDLVITKRDHVNVIIRKYIVINEIVHVLGGYQIIKSISNKLWQIATKRFGYLFQNANH